MLEGALPASRWYTVRQSALVFGAAQRARIGQLVDEERCRAASVELLERRAGGGLVLLDPHMLCCTIALPAQLVAADITESYRWVGDHVAGGLRRLGIRAARRVETDEARADVARLRELGDELSRLLLDICYGALSPHEVVVGAAKVVGLAQVRRRHASLVQIGFLLADQSAIADLVRVSSDSAREALRAALAQRSAGLDLAPPSIVAGLSPIPIVDAGA